MQPDSTFVTKIGGLAMAAAMRGAISTLDCKIAHYDSSVDPARPEFTGPCIFVFWHEYISFPVSLWGQCNVAMLVSQHRDAQWLVDAAHYLGYETVRGSTKRGGADAVRQLKYVCRRRNLAITPDGPQGPRRQMAMGPVYLSSRLEIPLIPIGFAYDRPWRCPTWDRFAIPRPFSRARSIWGPRMHIPRKIKRDGLEHYRTRVENMITGLTVEAEQWAESGTQRVGQLPFHRKRPGQTRGIFANPTTTPKLADGIRLGKYAA